MLESHAFGNHDGAQKRGWAGVGEGCVGVRREGDRAVCLRADSSPHNRFGFILVAVCRAHYTVCRLEYKG